MVRRTQKSFHISLRFDSVTDTNVFIFVLLIRLFGYLISSQVVYDSHVDYVGSSQTFGQILLMVN